LAHCLDVLKLLSSVILASIKMSIPPEILELVDRLTEKLNYIERQANIGLALASHLVERFPNNATLISLSAKVGNGLFFVSSFRNRIKSIVEGISGNNLSVKVVQQAGEDLSEMWGRIFECKMMASRSVSVLEDLQ
jgi:hypothetical protein